MSARHGLVGVALLCAAGAAILYTQQASAAATDSGETDMGEPKGIRNNNPLNLRYIAPPHNFNGQTGNDGNGYGVYDTWQSGMRAGGEELDQYYNRGLQTPAAIISTWAPPSENNTSAYIADVCARMNVEAGARLSWPYDKLELVMAMTWHENGENPYDLTDVQAAINS